MHPWTVGAASAHGQGPSDRVLGTALRASDDNRPGALRCVRADSPPRGRDTVECAVVSPSPTAVDDPDLWWTSIEQAAFGNLRHVQERPIARCGFRVAEVVPGGVAAHPAATIVMMPAARGVMPGPGRRMSMSPTWKVPVRKPAAAHRVPAPPLLNASMTHGDGIGDIPGCQAVRIENRRRHGMPPHRTLRERVRRGRTHRLGSAGQRRATAKRTTRKPTMPSQSKPR